MLNITPFSSFSISNLFINHDLTSGLSPQRFNFPPSTLPSSHTLNTSTTSKPIDLPSARPPPLQQKTLSINLQPSRQTGRNNTKGLVLHRLRRQCILSSFFISSTSFFNSNHNHEHRLRNHNWRSSDKSHIGDRWIFCRRSCYDIRLHSGLMLGFWLAVEWCIYLRT